jgi:hypothetical protein
MLTSVSCTIRKAVVPDVVTSFRWAGHLTGIVAMIDMRHGALTADPALPPSLCHLATSCVLYGTVVVTDNSIRFTRRHIVSASTQGIGVVISVYTVHFTVRMFGRVVAVQHGGAWPENEPSIMCKRHAPFMKLSVNSSN